MLWGHLVPQSQQIHDYLPFELFMVMNRIERPYSCGKQ